MATSDRREKAMLIKLQETIQRVKLQIIILAPQIQRNYKVQQCTIVTASQLFIFQLCYGYTFASYICSLNFISAYFTYEFSTCIMYLRQHIITECYHRTQNSISIYIFIPTILYIFYTRQACLPKIINLPKFLACNLYIMYIKLHFHKFLEKLMKH